MAPVARIMSDRTLVERLARGDRLPASELRRRHEPSLYALAYMLLLDPVAADIVVESVFEEVPRVARHLGSEHTVFGWLAERTRRRAQGLVHERRRVPPRRAATPMSLAYHGTI